MPRLGGYSGPLDSAAEKLAGFDEGETEADKEKFLMEGDGELLLNDLCTTAICRNF